MLCMAGFLTLRFSVCVCVHPCVCGQNISKSIEPDNFIFGGSLPSDPGRKPFNFEKKRQGLGWAWGVGLGGGVEIWP